jgi:2-C-methyl-D-erythritol 4-phosphate cytidylyltransferase
MLSAIVLAAGRSTRMGGSENKQFLKLAGKPLVWFSLDAFQRCPVIDEIVLVRRPDYTEEAERVGREFPKVTALADGGVERQNSVWNGLEKVRGDIVAVHDGARPLITPELIEATAHSAREHGTGIAATKIVDTIKEVNDDRTVSRTIDRSKLWAVQTPQTVRTEILRQAYRLVFEKNLVVTDEAAAVELLGAPVHLVDTPSWNLKITTPSDLAIADALLYSSRR